VDEREVEQITRHAAELEKAGDERSANYFYALLAERTQLHEQLAGQPQLELFPSVDGKAAAAAKNRAIRQVDENAHAVWKAVAMEKAREEAEQEEFPFIDGVRRRMPPDVTTHELRAWGAIMLAAARKGWIVKIGSRNTDAVSSHGGPRTRWRSLIYHPPQ
jgi:hypothetical protein